MYLCVRVMPPKKVWRCPFLEAHSLQGTLPPVVNTRLAFRRHMCLHHMSNLVTEDGEDRIVPMDRMEFERESARYRRRDQCGRAPHVASCTTSSAANYTPGAVATGGD